MQKLVIIWGSILLLAACNNTHQNTSDLSLNNGEKWKVNAEMKPHIEQENQILNNYLAQNETNYQELAEALKRDNNNLIKSCTMTGESHEELHKWLHPHMELLEQLSTAKDLTAAKGVIAQIEESFKTYHNYFE